MQSCRNNAVGLKTGTTDEAGCCLVGSVKAGNAGNEHVLTAIVIGANSNLDRYQIPEVLLTWGTGRLEAQQLSAASQTDEVSAAEDVNVNNQPGTDQDE